MRRVAPLAAVLLALAAGDAAAKDWKMVAVQNASGRDAAGVVLVFRAGGRVEPATPVTVFGGAGGCDAPSVKTRREKDDAAGHAVVTLTWGAPCVRAHAVVWFNVVAPRGPVILESGAWTGAAGDTLGILGAESVRVTELPTRPVTPRPLLVALGVLIGANSLLVAYALLRRRYR